MAVLLAGGAGYIGTHTAVEFLNAGYDVVIADDLYNSKKEAVRRVEKITGKRVPFYEIDVCDEAALRRVFAEQNIDTVVHFAGMKAVGESIAKPLMYYRNNLNSTLTLLAVVCVQLVRDGLRPGKSRAASGDHASRGLHQSLRLDEMDERTDPARRLRCGPGAFGGTASLLQSHRCP